MDVIQMQIPSETGCELGSCALRVVPFRDIETHTQHEIHIEQPHHEWVSLYPYEAKGMFDEHKK